MSDLEVLNVGEGDVKLSFDPDNPAERIRAARIVKDMLRRGYVLLAKRRGGKYQRVKAFDERTCEYVVADFDPLQAQAADAEEAAAEPDDPAAEPFREKHAPAKKKAPAKKRGGRRTKDTRLPAHGTKAVAVGKTAGG